MLKKKKESPAINERDITVTTDQEITAAEPDAGIPTFFLSRAVGWFAVALVIMGASAIFAFSGFSNSIEALAGAALIALISIISGFRTLRTAKKKEYFILRLTCTDVRPLSFLENIPSFINPASSTGFRGGRQVSLQSASGLKIIFTYERNRKFLVGARYDFYFRKPPEGEALTAATLERLRIDHSIVETDLTKDIVEASADKT